LFKRIAVAVAAGTEKGKPDAGSASAHAVLQSSNPAEGAVLQTAPGQVTLTFDETVSLPPQALQVLDSTQKDVAAGPATHPGGVGATVAVPLASGLARGSYLVSWHVISADSHPVSGAFVFSIGAAGKVAKVTVPKAGTGVGPLLGLARFASYTGVALLLGGLLFLSLCWQDGWSVKPSTDLLVVGGCLLALGTAGALLLDGPYVGGKGLRDSFDHQLLRTVEGTPYGRALVTRLLLLGVTAMVLTGLRRRAVTEEAGRITMLTLGTGIVLTFALTGHDGVGAHHTLATLSDGLHVAAMSAWLGGLVFLVAGLLRNGSTEQVRAGVPVFSRLAFCSVVVLAGTGLYQALRQVDAVGELFSTPYGRMLALKVLAVGGVLVVAERSRRTVQRKVAIALEPTVAQEIRPVVSGTRVDALVVEGEAVPLPGPAVVAWSGLELSELVAAESPRARLAWGEGSGARTVVAAPAATTGSPAWELFLPGEWAHRFGRPVPPASGRSAGDPLAAARRLLTRSVGLELLGAIVILALTAGLVVTRPAREVAAAADQTRALTTGPVHLTVQTSTEGMAGMLSLTVDATRAQGGTPWSLAELDAELSLPARHLGPLKVTLHETTPGHYTASMVTVPASGSWQLALNARTDDFDVYPATESVRIR
jgi:copper transport protein